MLSQIQEHVPQTIRQFVVKHWKEITVVSMATKLASFLVVFLVLPLGLTLPKHSYQTKISLDQNNPFALTLGSSEVNVATAASNLETKKMAKSPGQIAIGYGPAIEREGSYFQNIYKAAGSKFGVPWQLLQAVHYVETGCSDSGYKSSYAGAQGPMQFMPGTFRAYAQDGNGDGVTSIYDVNDAIYSAANLLAAGGAASGNIDDALFNYNHSQHYVNTVKEVMYSIK